MKNDASKVNVEVQQQDSSADLGRAGKVLAGLDEIGTPEAIQQRDKLSALVATWQHLVQQVVKAKAQRESKARVAAMNKMLISVIDGFRALLGFVEPKLSELIPVRSKLEQSDPLGFASMIIEVLQGHDERAKRMAHELQTVVALVRAESDNVKGSDANLSALEDQANVARLNMREYELACVKYITLNTPKGHTARTKLKRNSKKSSSTEPSKPAPTPPSVNGTAPSTGAVAAPAVVQVNGATGPQAVAHA
ncbi:MAG: hypothetical protein JST54_04250 [Deltaproteobacteria bacterium]|nr:hypothetical protein [Deltaproteobacteria bacterium]